MADDKKDKRFFIKNEQNNLVLEVSKVKPEGKVTEHAQRKDETKVTSTQLFYVDHVHGMVRSTKDDLCLDVITKKNKKLLVVNTFNPESVYQKWQLVGETLINTSAKLTIATAAKNEIICDTINDTQPAGKWSFQYIQPKYFYVKNRDNNLYLDVSNNNKSPEAEVQAYKGKWFFTSNQTWYEDSSGMIRSKLNDYVLDVIGGRTVMNPVIEGNPWQQWQTLDGFIVNIKDSKKVISLAEQENKICVADKDSSLLKQKWKIEYV